MPELYKVNFIVIIQLKSETKTQYLVSELLQLNNDEMASVLNPRHKIVLSSRDIDLTDSGCQHAKSSSEALEILKSAGVGEAIIGGWPRCCSFFHPRETC